MKNKITILLSILLGVGLYGCEGFFGIKTKKDFIAIPDLTLRQVAYVPVLPAISGFLATPIHVSAGFDELIYVVDSGRAIVAFDQAGNRLGQIDLPGVSFVAQNRQLDLLAIARFDTTIAGQNYSLATIYRIDIKTGNYNFGQSKIKKKIVHPFYIASSFLGREADAEQVRLNSIGIMGNGQYYVSRSGPRQNNSIGGPDDAVLLFDHNDKFISAIAMQGQSGALDDRFFGKPYCLTTLAQPPQSFSMPNANSADFIIGSLRPDLTLKVQYIQVSPSTDGPPSYNVKFLAINDTSIADDFLYRPFRFLAPQAITYSGDGTNYIFVLDRDSLYQFSATGLEGVRPPAGSSSRKNIRVSFGGKGNGFLQFDRPKGVAYLDKIVYVADAGNKRILRFKLTTDFD